MINYGIGHLAYGLLNFIVVLILLTFLIIALFGLIRFLHSRKWLNAPKCEKCGAPVTLQDKECPECGEATRCAAHQRRKKSSLDLLIVFSSLFTIFSVFGIKVTVDYFAPGNQLKEMLSHNGGAYDSADFLYNSGPYWKLLISESEDRVLYNVVEFRNNNNFKKFGVTEIQQATEHFPWYKWEYFKSSDVTYGKYSVDNDKTLTITLSDGTVQRYSFDEKNKLDGDTWYISGNTLVIGVREYEPCNVY